jgi:hypothetical protein
MNETNFDPHRYAVRSAEILKQQTELAVKIDKALYETATAAGEDDDEVRKAVLLLIVSTLTSRGWSVEGLCDAVRNAAVRDQRPTLPTQAELDAEMALMRTAKPKIDYDARLAKQEARLARLEAESNARKYGWEPPSD